jgi:hypothetical protein
VQNIKQAAAAFLADNRVAVTGVSRTARTHGSNNVYRRLRERGYPAFAVNPNTGQVEGHRCYPNPATIPGGPTADLGHKIMRLMYPGHVPEQVCTRPVQPRVRATGYVRDRPQRKRRRPKWPQSRATRTRPARCRA